jgi:flagellar basal-body rod modification protein FlgD
MTDPIAARVAPTMTVNQALAGASGSGTTAKSPTDAMGSDTFLKLLVAQLKYQDPSKPADATAMMGQTAQFQMVEKLQQLADQNTQMLSEQQASGAIALVGRSVSYTQGDQTLRGVVDSLKLTAGGPVLAIGTAQVPLSAITEITSASSAPTAG